MSNGLKPKQPPTIPENLQAQLCSAVRSVAFSVGLIVEAQSQIGEFLGENGDNDQDHTSIGVKFLADDKSFVLDDEIDHIVVTVSDAEGIAIRITAELVPQ